jgi:NIMA (never in mitosis gene a)-related kinase
MVMKIGDFGISTKQIMSSTLVGTPSYLSPEVCQGMPYDKKCDIWALGCILAEMACLKKYFEGVRTFIL